MTFKAYAHPDTFAEFLSGKENIFFVYLVKTNNYLDKASDYTVEVIIDTDQYDFVYHSSYKQNLPIKVSKKQTPEEIFRKLELTNKQTQQFMDEVYHSGITIPKSIDNINIPMGYKPVFPPNQLIDANKIL